VHQVGQLPRTIFSIVTSDNAEVLIFFVKNKFIGVRLKLQLR